MGKAPATSLSSPELKEISRSCPLNKHACTLSLTHTHSRIFISLWVCVNIHSSFPSVFFSHYCTRFQSVTVPWQNSHTLLLH